MDELLSILRAIDADKSDGSLLIAADWFEERFSIFDKLMFDSCGLPTHYAFPGWFARAIRNMVGNLNNLACEYDYIDHFGSSKLTFFTDKINKIPVFISQPYHREGQDSFRLIARTVRSVAQLSGGVGCYIRDSVYQRTNNIAGMPRHLRCQSGRDSHRMRLAGIDPVTTVTLIWFPHPDLIEKGLDRYDRSFIRR